MRRIGVLHELAIDGEIALLNEVIQHRLVGSTLWPACSTASPSTLPELTDAHVHLLRAAR